MTPDQKFRIFRLWEQRFGAMRSRGLSFSANHLGFELSRGQVLLSLQFVGLD